MSEYPHLRREAEDEAMGRESISRRERIMRRHRLALALLSALDDYEAKSEGASRVARNRLAALELEAGGDA